MARYDNVSGGTLVLPDGTEIAHGENADIDAATLKNAGVAEWVSEGRLVQVKPERKTDKTE